MRKHPLAKLDQRYLWHPFTQMRDWLKGEPLVIERGDGARLWDARGREYLDANSSIWTNLHGHNHPKINTAIRTQLTKGAHTSALGLASGPAARRSQPWRMLRASAADLLRTRSATRRPLWVPIAMPLSFATTSMTLLLLDLPVSGVDGQLPRRRNTADSKARKIPAKNS